MKRVIIVTGTPGTGKTTVSKRLAREIGACYIPLTRHVSSHRLYRAVDNRRASKVIDMKRTRTELKRLLSTGSKPVVIDSHIPDVIAPKRIVKRVIVLRCHPKILKARLRAKRWRRSKVQENLLAEILDSCLLEAVEYYGWKPVYEIDTSQKSVEQCVTFARAILRDRSHKRGRKTDWIATLNREHSLLRYLK
jgi:adenylate kinase